MAAHASFAVFTTRTDDPSPRLLADADVPRLDARDWHLSAVSLDADEETARPPWVGARLAEEPGVGAPGGPNALLEVLRTLAFERQPAIPRRHYPTPHLYRTALLLDIRREESLYPDAMAFATAAVAALTAWADGPVVDLTAERVWTRREWARKVSGKPFDVDRHVAVHAEWSADGRSADLHTHGMAKFAHRDFAALDVPDEGTRAASQLLRHLARVRALTLEPLEPGHAFDPGFGQPMVAFVEPPAEHAVSGHLGAPPSVVVDYDVDRGEAVAGLYGLLGSAKALDRDAPAERRRWRLTERQRSAS